MPMPRNTDRQKWCGAQWRSPPFRHAAAVALLMTGLGVAGQPARVAAEPPAPPIVGLWFDDTGDGAIDIHPCADRMCGRIAWLKAPNDASGRPLTDQNNPDPKQRRRPICGLDIIGDAKRQPDGAWDQGWIYDPKQGKSFDVELKQRSLNALQVMGYLGVKFLSETFIWKRAPAETKRCDLPARPS